MLVVCGNSLVLRLLEEVHHCVVKRVLVLLQPVGQVVGDGAWKTIFFTNNIKRLFVLLANHNKFSHLDSTFVLP